MTEFIRKLESSKNLSFEESKMLFSNIMEGKYDENNIVKILNALSNKGETKDELAGGIKVALITTVSGLIVAIILQIFYNYIVSKIDSLVNQMEDASISLIDVLVKHNSGK